MCKDADIKPSFEDDRDLTELETMQWNPDNLLTDKQVDQYLVVARSVFIICSGHVLKTLLLKFNLLLHYVPNIFPLNYLKKYF